MHEIMYTEVNELYLDCLKTIGFTIVQNQIKKFETLMLNM